MGRGLIRKEPINGLAFLLTLPSSRACIILANLANPWFAYNANFCRIATFPDQKSGNSNFFDEIDNLLDLKLNVKILELSTL
jgi:hypothetical protein